MTALPDPGRSRAVLIGTSTYTYLENLPAVHNNLAGFRDVLIDPKLGGLPANKCTIVDEPTSGLAVYRALRKDATVAKDTLLVYFAGHGRTGNRNELYLCLTDTNPDELSFTALAYEDLREAVAASQATKKVVILDCCFSGRALADQAGDEETIVGQVGIEGTYILTATAANAVALAPPGERYTAFTGTLLNLLHTGIPGGLELLTFAAIYPHLRFTLTSRQLPQPRQQGSDTIAHLALTRNPAYVRHAARAYLGSTAATTSDVHGIQSGEGRARNDLARATRLLSNAERIAYSLPDGSWKASALSEVARALAATDPDHAERIANSITDKHDKAAALSDVAKALAATDPDHAAQLFTDAEEIAHSIMGESFKAAALSGIAKALAATDPDHAAQLFTDAEEIAHSIMGESFKAAALSGIARALAATDPDHAERITNSITDEYDKAKALSGIARALAATDPDHAERIANSITDEYDKAKALSDVAKALAATDPDHAERIANSITDKHNKAKALSSIAKALAATDPDQAERIANSITEEEWKAKALSGIAEALASTSSA